MKVQCTQKNEILYVSIIGAIYDQDARKLNERLQRMLRRQFKEAVFDLSQMPLMCSSAIGRLMLFYKHLHSRGSGMRVKGVNHQVLDLLQFTNMNLLFPIES